MSLSLIEESGKTCFLQSGIIDPRLHFLLGAFRSSSSLYISIAICWHWLLYIELLCYIKYPSRILYSTTAFFHTHTSPLETFRRSSTEKVRELDFNSSSTTTTHTTCTMTFAHKGIEFSQYMPNWLHLYLCGCVQASNHVA